MLSRVPAPYTGTQNAKPIVFRNCYAARCRSMAWWRVKKCYSPAGIWLGCAGWRDRERPTGPNAHDHHLLYANNE